MSIRVAIHQPNYLPWLGFFDKMRRCDVFVLLDIVPYTKNGYQNRCLIKGPQGGIWLTVPVLTKGRFGQLTKQVEINNHTDWRDKHWKSILQNYRKARCFEQYAGFFEQVYQRSWNKLVEINDVLIRYIVRELGITIELVCASALGVGGSGTELILNICKKVGADTYLSGPSGKQYLAEERFQQEQIQLIYHHFNHPVYAQIQGSFVPNLSVVDLMFNHGADSVSILKQTA